MILAVIVAGGRGRRLGQDKALAPLAGRPLIAHVIARLRPQVARIVINGNGDPARFATFGLPVVSDNAESGLDGPFLGLATAFKLFTADPMATHLLTVPTDVPFLPGDLVAALQRAGADAAFPEADGRAHPTIALWSRAGAKTAATRLQSFAGERLQSLIEASGGVGVSFPEPNAFLNVNTPSDLDEAERRAAEIGR